MEGATVLLKVVHECGGPVTSIQANATTEDFPADLFLSRRLIEELGLSCGSMEGEVESCVLPRTVYECARLQSTARFRAAIGLKELGSLAAAFCRASACGLDAQPRLTVSSSLLKPAFRAVHEDLCVAECEAGFFRNAGIFAADNRLVLKCTAVSFLHDEREIRARIGGQTRSRCDAGSSDSDLRIGYSAITSVCLDAIRSANAHCDVFVSVFTKHARRRADGTMVEYSDRVFHYGGQDEARRLADSSVFRLRFARPSLVQVLEALLRLCQRCDIPLEFACIVKPGRASVTPSLPVCADLGSHTANFCFEALLSRGAAVRSQLLGAWVAFTGLVKRRVADDRATAEAALEQLLDAVDERRHIVLLDAFVRLYACMRAGNLLALRANVPTNCVLVRKAIVTPTRVLLLPAEVQMGNRVVRTFGDDAALRVSFRDEDGSRLPSTTFALTAQAQRNLEKRFEDVATVIRQRFEEGLQIGGRHYRFVAWSNSQLRDHGCYFFSRTTNRLTGSPAGVAEMRRWMGDFADFDSVSKMMSRMGQSFTQAQVALTARLSLRARVQNTVPLGEGDYAVLDDVIGGRMNPETGERYTFSDGIGRMTEATRDEICHMLKLPPHTSAFQVRFGGFKGMLAVDPSLKYDLPHVKVAFRRSMLKYKTDSSRVLEVVKHSDANPVTLNKPLIMILDQASAAQDAPLHERIVGHVFELLERHLNLLAEMFYVEATAAEQLSARAAAAIDYSTLRGAGFALTREPFFRRLLAAIYRYNIEQKLAKLKVEIPMCSGRTMYGVLDESGCLREGEVFIQYTDGDQFHTAHGAVLVTKNPCVVAGDVRLLTAVDEDALRHHVDVIVFPRVGARPHPDEMAGSDLDGDEFAVFWDKHILLRGNADAMDFPKLKSRPVRQVTEADIADFFLHFVFHDQIGSLSNAYLAWADAAGMDSGVCDDISFKCAVSVDFAKSGKGASLDTAERPLRWPDFMLKTTQPSYESKRLLGRLFRSVQRIGNAQRSAQLLLSQDFAIDGDLLLEGRRLFEDDAAQTYKQYANEIQSLMDAYGIADEASLISGHMVHMRSRISEREREDFSFFSTERIVQLRLSRRVAHFRQLFFSEFDGEEMYQSTAADGSHCLEYAPADMQAKASAWYALAYARPDNCLSFAWLVWDVLAVVKKAAMFGGALPKAFPQHPVADRLRVQIQTYARRRNMDLRERLSRICDRCDELRLYCSYYEGFDALFAALCTWAKAESCLLKPFDEVALGLLLIKCGLSCPVDETADAVFLPRVLDGPLSAYASQLRVNGGIGRFLLCFFKWTSSRKFADQPVLRLSTGGSARARSLVGGEWRRLSSASSRALHLSALSAHFGALDEGLQPCVEMSETEPTSFICDDITLADSDIAQTLKRLSGSTAVCARRPRVTRPELVLVTSFGTAQANERLRRLLGSHDLVDKLTDQANGPSSISLRRVTALSPVPTMTYTRS